ncbi:MAG: galactose-1-phosphate uridylyltransferase [Firmicutes bacterium]|nr:galactose-1-phosphate uridylyltransferase [Bacillota bacterium]
MPELRKDPTTETWVVISQERSKRPSDFKLPKETKAASAGCPFCYGNEGKTPPEVYAAGPSQRQPNSPGWSVRVVPNKFPALRLEEWPPNGGVEVGGFELAAKMPGFGAHEVLVESPNHYATLASHSQEHLDLVLKALSSRCHDLAGDRRMRYIQIFKNWGHVAGASLEHTHLQLILLPRTPRVVAHKLRIAQSYFQRHGLCLYCDLIKFEGDHGERIIEETDHFLVFAPYASRFPFETWILPKKHQHSFGQLTDEQSFDLSGVLKRLVGHLELSFEDLPYNLIWQTAPYEPGHESYYHWHLELLPRLTTIAGFELGSGYYINPTAPEVAAGSLREAALGKASMGANHRKGD